MIQNHTEALQPIITAKNEIGYRRKQLLFQYTWPVKTSSDSFQLERPATVRKSLIDSKKKF